MLKNYFNIAIAVLKRRKLFTVISLFGISFTLMILIVLTAFLDQVISPGYPELNRNRSLYINTISLQNSKFGFHMNTNASFYFLNHYAGSLKTPEKVTVFSLFGNSNGYVNGKSFTVNIKYTDASFWEVLKYQFVEGKPFTKQQIDNGERIAVISEDTKKKYFGDMPSVIGQYIEAGNERLKVLGVVKNVSATRILSYGDIYAPYTIDTRDYRDHQFQGSYVAIILAKSSDDMQRIKQEYQSMISKIPIENKDFDRFYSFADTYLESWTRQMFGGSGPNSGYATFVLIISVFVLLFMLLPTINLVNINISRILERSSEIAVRKSFGASINTLVFQFLVENMILTIIGGIIGVLLSFFVLSFINGLNILSETTFTINLRVLLYGFIACLLFGVLSGVYPAWRMSKLKVVDALKAQ